MAAWTGPGGNGTPDEPRAGPRPAWCPRRRRRPGPSQRRVARPDPEGVGGAAQSRPSSGPHPVADAADGQDVTRSGRVVAELLPDVDHVNVDAVIIPDPAWPPDPFDELLAGVGKLGSLGQCVQQVELGAGELYRGLSQVDLSGLRVQAQVPDRAHLWVPSGLDGGAWAAKQAADTGGQLSGGEGFGHVVVSPDRQPDERVDLFTSGGQHDHVSVGEGAQLAAYLDAVDARQHHVEHADVGWVAPRGSHGLLPIGCRGDHKPLVLQVAGHHSGQAGLVVHDQRPVWGADRGGSRCCQRDQSSIAMNVPCQVWYKTAPVTELTDLIPLTTPLLWRSRVK